MGWKNWPYWLKGGILFSLINALLSTLIYLILLILKNNFDTIRFAAEYSFFLVISLLFINPAWYFSGPRSYFDIIFGLVVGAALYFIIGAIIGWIYGKIKSRK